MADMIDRLRDYYLLRLQQHGATAEGVGWGSMDGQRLRFKALLACVRHFERPVTLLDVGCGYGALWRALPYAHDIRYTGIDALPEMIQAARARWNEEARFPHQPPPMFIPGDVRSRAFQADFVFASGIFALSDEAEMREVITAMWRSCRIATAFNVLSLWGKRPEATEFHADPVEVLQFCRTLTPWVVLRHDYLPHDFTVAMYREARV